MLTEGPCCVRTCCARCTQPTFDADAGGRAPQPRPTTLRIFVSDATRMLPATTGRTGPRPVLPALPAPLHAGLPCTPASPRVATTTPWLCSCLFPLPSLPDAQAVPPTQPAELEPARAPLLPSTSLRKLWLRRERGDAAWQGPGDLAACERCRLRPWGGDCGGDSSSWPPGTCCWPHASDTCCCSC